MDDEKTFASIDSCESRAIMVNYLGKAGKYSFAKQAFKRGTVQLICSYRYYRKHDKSKMKRIKDLYRTYKDALKKGLETSEKEIKKNLSKEEYVISKNILKKDIKSSKMYIEVFYKLYENIASIS